MRLDPATQILDLDNKPIEEMSEGKPRPVTFGLLAERALTVQKVGQPGPDQYERYKLALLFHNATEPVEVSVDQAKILKTAIFDAGALQNGYSVLVAGRMIDIVESADPGKAPP